MPIPGSPLGPQRVEVTMHRAGGAQQPAAREEEGEGKERDTGLQVG